MEKTIEDVNYFDDEEHEGVIIGQTPSWLEENEEPSIPNVNDWKDSAIVQPKTTWTEWLWGKKVEPVVPSTPTKSYSKADHQKILSDYQKAKKKLDNDKLQLQKRRTEREIKKREEQKKRDERVAEYKRKKNQIVNIDDSNLEKELNELQLAEEEDKRGLGMDAEQEKNDEEQMIAELEEELRLDESLKKTKTMGMKELFATYSPNKKGGSPNKRKRHNKKRKVRK